MVSGATIPCIDIYEIPKAHLPFEEASGSLEIRKLSSMALVASFQFPPLNVPRQCRLDCWPSKSLRNLSKFAIRLPVPGGLFQHSDQVMVLRLGGRIGGKSEKLHGVVLLSRILELISQAQGNGPRHTMATPDKAAVEVESASGGIAYDPASKNTGAQEHHPIFVKWHQWSSAISLQPSTSSTVLEPMETQVASIARSRTDKSRAVMVIRDYNQEMMYAPPGHLTRNLGHPTDNRASDVYRIGQETIERPFRLVTEPRTMNSTLFGQIVEHGLGHRMRTLSLGEYSPNTATSRLFWNGIYMMLVPATPAVSCPCLHSIDQADVSGHIEVSHVSP